MPKADLKGVPAADVTFDLNHQALAVLHYLAAYELTYPEDVLVDVKTAPWYNGRERGVVFSVGALLTGEYLHVAVFEHRNSDSLCALRWVNTSGYMNPPTIVSDGNRAYPTDNKSNDIVFQVDPGEIGEMATWVRDQMQNYLDESILREEEKKKAGAK